MDSHSFHFYNEEDGINFYVEIVFFMLFDLTIHSFDFVRFNFKSSKQILLIK